MSANQSSFAKLQALARTTCSTQRRELLRDVTDMFFDGDDQRSDAEGQIFDDIIGAVARDLEVEARSELAEKVSHARNAPAQVARRLAMDEEVSVAAPILSRSTALTDEDLVSVIAARGQDHLMAVSKREQVSEVVSQALVDKGDDTVVASLLENDGAHLSRETYEQVTDRAETSEVLQAPLVNRKTVPLDLLNEMYLVVGERLRRQILERNDSVDPRELEAALAKSRVKVAQTYGALPGDFQEAEAWVRKQKLTKKLKPELLVALLRDHADTKFRLALADLADVDFDTTRGIHERQDVDGLALLCRARDFPRALFVTLAVYVGGRSDDSFTAASEFGVIYNEITAEAAQRALRFWRLRKTQERKSVA